MKISLPFVSKNNLFFTQMHWLDFLKKSLRELGWPIYHSTRRLVEFQAKKLQPQFPNLNIRSLFFIKELHRWWCKKRWQWCIFGVSYLQDLNLWQWSLIKVSDLDYHLAFQTALILCDYFFTSLTTSSRWSLGQDLQMPCKQFCLLPCWWQMFCCRALGRVAWWWHPRRSQSQSFLHCSLLCRCTSPHPLSSICML